MNHETLELVRDHVGWLTINRPDRLSAPCREIIQEPRHFFVNLEENLDIRLVVRERRALKQNSSPEEEAVG